MNKIVFGSLAMDLKRVALGYNRGSISMAMRFLKEVYKRKEEIDSNSVKPYIKKLMLRLDSLKTEKDTQKLAEDALMYSTLFQNAAIISS